MVITMIPRPTAVGEVHEGVVRVLPPVMSIAIVAPKHGTKEAALAAMASVVFTAMPASALFTIARILSIVTCIVYFAVSFAYKVLVKGEYPSQLRHPTMHGGGRHMVMFRFPVDVNHKLSARMVWGGGG